jgi:hypothetical protein
MSTPTKTGASTQATNTKTTSSKKAPVFAVGTAAQRVLKRTLKNAKGKWIFLFLT